MGLPKIERPRFPITIPSTGKKTFFIPFSVKEEKILLIAQESKDPEQIVMAIKQIVGNCVDGIDADKQPMFDLEYLLLHIRSKSVGDIIPFEIEDPDTKEKVKLEFDINKVEIVRQKNHSKNVKINDEYTMVMNYPTIDQLTSVITSENISIFDIMSSCISALVDSNGETYKFEDFSESEINEFLESLDANAVKGMREFFDTIPVVKSEIKYKTKDGDAKTYVVQGLNGFFI